MFVAWIGMLVHWGIAAFSLYLFYRLVLAIERISQK